MSSQFWTRFFGSRGGRTADDRLDDTLLASGDAVSRARILADDFPAGFIPPGEPAAVLAFWGSLTPPPGHPLGTSPITGYWLRTKQGPYLMKFPADGHARMPDGIHWSTGTKSSTVLLVSVREPNLSPQKLILEIYRVAGSTGHVITDGSGYCTPTLLGTVEHLVPTGGQLPTSPSMPFAAHFGKCFGVAYSDVAYRVDKNGGLNPWLTVNVASKTFIMFDGEYDLSGGTPSGQYDLRVACQNGPDNTGQNPVYPPPAVKQTDWGVPFNSDVGCFRWEPSSLYNPADPTSYPFRVYSYGFSIDMGTAPPLAPQQFGSTWEDITTTPAASARNQLPQDAQLSAVPDPMGAFSTIGALYDEGTKRTVYAIRPSISTANNLRYKYATSMKVKRVDGTFATQTGHIYLLESVATRSEGLKVYRDGAVLYEDLPQGILGWTRLNEGAWPSDGGIYAVTSPPFTKTFRAPFFVAGGNPSLAGQQGDTSRLLQEGQVYPDGSFWVVVTSKPFGQSEVFYLTQSGADFSFTPPTLPTNRVTIREGDDGNLYVAGMHVSGPLQR